MSQKINRYCAAIVAGFAALYLSTHLPLFVSDSLSFVEEARAADPQSVLFGYPGHYLQVVLAPGVWRLLGVVGITISLETVWLGMCLAGTIAAIVFLGLIAADLLGTQSAAWIAALVFGTTLNMWWQWNGELYQLALGFLTPAVFFALRRHVVASAILWGLSVACHIEFVLAAPVLVGAMWMRSPGGETAGQFVRRVTSLLVSAGTITVAIILVPMWAVGKWSNPTALTYWFSYYFKRGAASGHVVLDPEVFRATKGLLTAFTVGGHHWRDILTGRAPLHDPWFLVAAGVGLLVIIATGLLIVVALKNRRLAVFALLWIAPFQLLFNWWFCPNDAKYHAGSLPGVVLLVTGGLVHLTTGMTRGSRTVRYGLCASYIVICAAFNLFGSILPMRSLGADTLAAAEQIRQLNAGTPGGAAMVSCTDSPAVAFSGIDNLRIKRIWNADVAQTQKIVRSWVTERLAEGKPTYVLDRSCRPDEWILTAPASFDLTFLERDFRLVPAGITRVPTAQVWEVYPFSWRRADVVRVMP